MNSVYKNYAREIKKNGQLTGQFFLNKDDAKRLYKEVKKTHQKYGYTSNNSF